MNKSFRLVLVLMILVLMIGLGWLTACARSIEQQAALDVLAERELRILFDQLIRLPSTDRLDRMRRLVHHGACLKVQKYYRAIAIKLPSLSITKVRFIGDNEYSQLERFYVELRPVGGRAIPLIYNRGTRKFEITATGAGYELYQHWKAGHDDAQYMQRRPANHYLDDC